MNGHDELLNVRDTAQRLGVHENTVRNWSREGVLPAVRLPGSRYLRFLPSDVELLIAQRAARTPSLQTERRAMNPEFVTANQLKQWPVARPRDAQERFPELIRRLLVETPGVTNISIRSGDGVALAGYDGLADSAGTSFLPAGQLTFEFGVGERPAVKATDDYNKRVSTTPSPKVFVFATPRRWPGGVAWAEERKLEGHFADVKVLDADDLDGWLGTAPGALYWISEHLGLRPRDVTSLDMWWKRFSDSTNPSLPSDLFLAGRRVQANQLVERLNDAPTLTVVQSEWTDDSLAFLQAAIGTEKDDHRRGTAVVVSSVDAWDSILDRPGRATLIPLFDGADVARAIDKGHHVITVVDRAATARRPVDVSLPRLGRREGADALRNVGLEFGLADRLASLGRRSIPALRRRLSLNPKIKRPDWADPPDGRILATLLLAGSWTSDPNDIAILEAITNEPWSAIEPLLEKLSASTDPVVRKVSNTWAFVSPEEAFVLSKDSLTEGALQRSVAVVTQLLSEAPGPDLAPAERVIAGIRGVRRPFSAALHEGLARGLALLGAMGAEIPFDNGSTAADLVVLTVRRLLESANADGTGKLWYQLASVLPLLAEAAPAVFIEAIDSGLREHNPTILKLFAEDDDAALTFRSSSPHPHLLWAIETICWSSDQFVDGIRVLTQLASMEPGGKSGNRPIASLTSILCGWARHTSATLPERVEALDAVYDVADEIGWNLTFELWPNSGSIIIPPATPRFRDWRPTDATVPMTEWITFTHVLVDRAIRHAGDDAERLVRLAMGMPRVSPIDQERIIALFTELVDGDKLDEEARLLVWDQLRSLTTHHEQFASEQWALPADVLIRLRDLNAALEPRTGSQRFAYLFDWHPELQDFGRGDFETYHAELRKLRFEALRAVVDSGTGLNDLTSLAQRASSPTQVGWALAEVDEVSVSELLPWLESSDPALTDAASAWIGRRVQLCGSQWLLEALRSPTLRGQARQVLICNAPPTPEVWHTLHETQEDEELYWQKATFDAVAPSAVGEAVQQLVDHGRAWTATAVASIAIIDSGPDEKSTYVTPEMVTKVLDGALQQRSQSGELSNMTAYYVGELLDYLAKTDPGATARYEFAFFRLLEHQREPAALNHLLATQPENFVSLVVRAYRGRGDQRRELSEQEQGHVRQAWWVLNEWKGFPGRRDDGLIDREVMENWVRAARLAFSEADRADIGDEMIGQAFARSPVGEDGAWPVEALRDLIETIGSREFENGVILGRLNARGVTWRGVYDGGEQERALANQYRGWSALTRAKWPRTARILRELADSYERDARREDTKAELDADRG
jgi:predicted DNA-binding transcriptional regulator AlpA